MPFAFLRCLKEDIASVSQIGSKEGKPFSQLRDRVGITCVPSRLPKSNASNILNSLPGFSAASHFIAHFHILH